MEVNEFWHSGRVPQRPQNVKKLREENFCNFLKFFGIFQLWPQICKKKHPRNFLGDFWLKRPCWGWRTRIWPKTRTRTCFCRHFGEKSQILRVFWWFLVPITMSSFMELNIPGKCQGSRLCTTYLSREGLSRNEKSQTCARCHIGPSIPQRLNKVFQSSLQFPVLEHRCCRTCKIHWRM